ncbi:MAG: hypothetical protein BMS9Abin02_0400 [Anaerolineae bacterium]|nr:MAG: hypothetical protein BMS9Abin02_0400 [Anaerolineae bacterium]
MHRNELNLPPKLKGRWLVNLAVGLVLAVGVIWFAANFSYVSWDFRNNLWGPSRLLVQGQSPYRLDLLFERGNPVWLHPAIGAFFPLGWISFPLAANLWLIANAAILIAIIMLVARSKISLLLFAAVSLIVILFPPTITHIQLGQFTLLAMLLFMVAAIYSQTLPIPAIALMIAITLAKPQLGVLVIPGIILSIYRHRGARAAVALTLLTALSIFVLSIPLFIAEPQWVADFLAAIGKNPAYLQPSSYSLLPHQFGDFGFLLWLIFGLIVFVINLSLWWRHPPERAILWSLALTPLVTPYTWSWDFVLVLPLFIDMLIKAHYRRTRLFLVGGYLLFWFSAVALAMSGDIGNDQFWWIPYILWALILLAMGLEERLRLKPQPIFKP